MDVFHISDELVFKSVYDNDGKSRPASMVIETKEILTTSSMLINNPATPNQKMRDSLGYHWKTKQRGHSTRGLSDDNIGLLDYAFVKLTMDNDIFTETFFNTYKSFTTTTTVLENMAKRYVGAKSCSVSISKILDRSDDSKMKINEDTNLVSSSLYDQNFPVWDMKVTDDENITLFIWQKSKSAPRKLYYI
ncbi:Rho GTPase activating protein (RhoGAP) [Saccharomyces cerevisiae]|nr:Rho GTPase activating protein (RhoGAP) [Saccharomyces boulardii (nom. inval.)]